MRSAVDIESPGVRQPELGAYDTYDWLRDPKIDTDGDGTSNAFDAAAFDPDRD